MSTSIGPALLCTPSVQQIELVGLRITTSCIAAARYCTMHLLLLAPGQVIRRCHDREAAETILRCAKW